MTHSIPSQSTPFDPAVLQPAASTEFPLANISQDVNEALTGTRVPNTLDIKTAIPKQEVGVSKQEIAIAAFKLIGKTVLIGGVAVIGAPFTIPLALGYAVGWSMASAHESLYGSGSFSTFKSDMGELVAAPFTPFLLDLMTLFRAVAEGVKRKKKEEEGADAV